MEVDSKVSQRVFKDFQRGLHIPDIAERHNLPTRAVNQVVKLESVVHSRVQAELAKRDAKAAKLQAKPGKGKK